jgi:hypothetical protein
VHRPRTIVDHLLRNSLGPIATSPELCVSRKAFRCCHTRGSHPKIAASSGWGPCSSSRVASLRRRTRPNRPLAGSMWGATRTHRKPCCNWRLVAEQADWAMVPRRHGRLRGSEPKASAKGPALWRLSRTTTQGRTLLSPAAACSLRWAKYWRSSLPDLLSTLKKKHLSGGSPSASSPWTHLKVATASAGSLPCDCAWNSASLVARCVFPVPGAPHRTSLLCSDSSDTNLWATPFGINASKAKAATGWSTTCMVDTLPTAYPTGNKSGGPESGFLSASPSL